MSTCSIKLYKTKITPERNCIVESIQSYLGGLTATQSYSEFQYQKILLDTYIKIPVNQQYANLQDIGNYVDILQDARHYYYFILSARWKGEGVVQLELSLDTLNTYQSDWQFDDKTEVIREHKNRWKDNTTNLPAASTVSKTFVIDKTDEGISGIATEMTKTVIEDDELSTRCKWYLVYRTDENLTTNSNQPVRCELYPESTELLTVVADDTILSSSFANNTMYYVFYNTANSENYNVQYRLHDYNNDTWSAWSNALGTTNKYGLAFRLDLNGRFAINSLNKTTSNNNTYLDDPSSTWTGGYDKIQFRNGLVKIRQRFISSENILLPDVIYASGLYSILGSGTTSVADINSLNRTDSRLIKIIECPYCPIDIDVDSDNIIYLPDGWIMKGNIITCNIVTEEMERIILTSTSISGMKATFVTGANVKKMTRNNALEPKIYHSAISTCKLLYDSYSNEIRREQITPSNSINAPTLRIRYKQSNTISSNLAFKWQVSTGDYASVGDYDQFLIATRNNESPIYSSNYLDYLRTGFNYDKKAKNRSISAGYIMTGIQIIGAGVSFALSGITGGISAAAGVSLVTSSIASLTNSIKTNIENNQSFKQKIEELQKQSASIYNSDDINLLSYYADDNRATIRYYEPMNFIKEKIIDLFYYCGYASQTKKIPQTNTRCWFNYLQCVPVFKNTENNHIYSNFQDDIIAKFNIGVTYYHRLDGEYDFDQQYENWESGLVD